MKKNTPPSKPESSPPTPESSPPTPKKRSLRADVSEVLLALSEQGLKAVVEAETIRVRRRNKRIDVAITRDILLRALTTYGALRPEETIAVEDAIADIKLHRRRRIHAGERALTIMWRGRVSRPMVQVPLSTYSKHLDLCPPDKKDGERARGEMQVRVEFLPNRIIIHTDRLASDDPTVYGVPDQTLSE
jgi:hypothetical protein